MADDRVRRRAAAAHARAERHARRPPGGAAARDRGRDATLAKAAVLNHGDLRLKNTLVDEDSGRLVALIDWESSTSLPAPCWELAVALHDLGIDEKEAFLTGYGIKPRGFMTALPFIRLFNVLNYAEPVARAAAALDRTALERFRLRFRGRLDLYGV